MSLSPEFHDKPDSRRLQNRNENARLRHLMISRRSLLAAPMALLPGPLHAQAAVGLHAHARRRTNEFVLLKDGLPVFTFRAAFGREAGPKRERDDARTPVGDYLLQPARRSARWKWFHPVDYPNAVDVADGRTRGLTRSQLGDEIGIHGYGGWPPTDLVAAHGVGWNWTSGCIAVSHDEIEIVRAMVQVPIPLRIDP